MQGLESGARVGVGILRGGTITFQDLKDAKKSSPKTKIPPATTNFKKGLLMLGDGFQSNAYSESQTSLFRFQHPNFPFFKTIEIEDRLGSTNEISSLFMFGAPRPFQIFQNCGLPKP